MAEAQRRELDQARLEAEARARVLERDLEERPAEGDFYGLAPLAAERDVSGRFAVCNDQHLSFVEFTRLMHAIDPQVPEAPLVLPGVLSPLLPIFDAVSSRLLGSPRLITPEAAATMAGRVYKVSTARARERLGWRPAIAPAESFRAMMETIRALRRAEGRTRMA